MKSISVFLDITNVSDFRGNNADIRRVQVVRQVIYLL